MADRAFMAQKRKDEEEQEARHEFKPTEVQIERMLNFLDERHYGILDSITRAAQKAIAAAGVAYGYESASKMLDAVAKMPEVKYEGRPKEKTKAVMDGLRELPSQPQASAEIREVSHFAWSYYNKELGKDVVTESKTETARSEFETDTDLERRKEHQLRGEDDERPMAMRVGHRSIAREPELVLVQRQMQVQEEERLRMKVAEGEREKARMKVATSGKSKSAPKTRPKIVELKEEVGEKAASAAAKPETPEDREAGKALLLAASKEKITPILEFVLKREKGEGLKQEKMEDAKKDLKLLEIDEKKLEIMERQVDGKIVELKKEVEFLATQKEEKKGVKLRALRRRLAFWNKAKGALRRMSGGFFGSIAKMVGGIFR